MKFLNNHCSKWSSVNYFEIKSTCKVVQFFSLFRKLIDWLWILVSKSDQDILGCAKNQFRRMDQSAERYAFLLCCKWNSIHKMWLKTIKFCPWCHCWWIWFARRFSYGDSSISRLRKWSYSRTMITHYR